MLRAVAILFLVLGGVELGLAILSRSSVAWFVVAGVLLALGAGLMVLAARRRGRKVPAVRSAATVAGGVIIAFGAVSFVVGLALLAVIVTAPFAIIFLVIGVGLMLVGATLAGASWLPWRRKQAPSRRPARRR